jgi:hypothetical protein
LKFQKFGMAKKKIQYTDSTKSLKANQIGC